MRHKSQISVDEVDLDGQRGVFGPERSPASNQFADLTAVLKGKDKYFKPWSETARVTSLSKSGAGLFIKKPCSAGRLVSLIIAMPIDLRRYDNDKRLYRIWGLVQYCYEAGGEDDAGFHVGVALIGRDAPDSYAKDPVQSYRVSGMGRDGLWKVEELDSPFKQRVSVRYWNQIDATLFQLDKKQRTIESENTITENISESGASVFTDLRVYVGEHVRFQSSSPAFSSLSLVRHRRIGSDNRTRIHLEFIENTFPILDVKAPIEEEEED